MFAGFGLLDPIVAEAFGMLAFEVGVGVLHTLLGEELVVVHAFGVAG